MLTEAEIQRTFRRMFQTKGYDEATCERAEALLDELRPESPLRLRLYNELEELREIATSGR